MNTNIVFGLVINNLSSAPPALNFGSQRLWDGGGTWKDINTAANTFDFTSIDHWIAKVPAGHDVLYTFGKVPAWAGGGTGNNNPPSDLGTTNANWKAFVTAFVTRYKGKIAAYELWNEPNASNYWNGTIPQLVKMTADAATIIRSIDPAAKLVGPSPSSGPALTQPAPWIQNYLNAGGIQDIVAFHSSYDIPTDVAHINAIKAVTSKEFWVTEGSWGPNGRDNFTDAQEVAFITNQYQTFQSLGIKRYYWYAYDNPLGALEINGVLTPAGQAYSNLAGGSVPTSSTINIPVPASQVMAPAQSVPVPPSSVTAPAVSVSIPASSVMAPSQAVPVPARQIALTIVDATAKGVSATLSGNTLTIADAGSPPPPPPPPPPATGIKGWLGADALTGTVMGMGATVTVNASAGPIRSGPGGTFAAVSPQPSPVIGAQVQIVGGPTTAGLTWWQVQFPAGSTPPNPPPPPPPPSGVRIAFPGAQGGGALAAGGRGGAVFEVTNLNDSGAGSLRAALQATGARTAIFRVAGNIAFLSRAQVSSPFLTIAGQTAPGSGIVIGGPNQKGEQIFISTHDVVCRYLTYDGNNPNTPTGPDTGTVGFELASGDIYNVIFDHISARWMGNKVFPVMSNVAGKGVHNCSWQWTLIYEPNVQHAVGIGTVYATEGSGMQTTDNDCHHCMFITVDHRLPLNQSGRNVRWVSNKIYNWGQFAACSMGGVQTDYICNDYVDSSGGNLNYRDGHVFLGEPGNANDAPGDWPNGDNLGAPSFYMLGNRGRAGTKNAATGGSYVQPTMTPNDAGQLSMCAQGSESGDSGSPMPSSWIRSTPLPKQQAPITADPVDTLDAVLLPTIGNSQGIDANGNWFNRRDREDARAIAYYQARGVGMLFTGQHSAPPVVAGTPYPSSQHDGLSDAWKQALGLDTSKPQNNVVMPDGYTALEWFLAGRKS